MFESFGVLAEGAFPGEGFRAEKFDFRTKIVFLQGSSRKRLVLRHFLLLSGNTEMNSK